MKDSIDQTLLEISTEQLFCKHGAIQINMGQRTQGSDLLAADVLHREHARGGVVLDGRGHDNRIDGLEVLSYGYQIARLDTIVEFEQQILAKLTEYALKLVALS